MCVCEAVMQGRIKMGLAHTGPHSSDLLSLIARHNRDTKVQKKMISSCCQKLETWCISFTILLPISSLPSTFLFLILQFPTWPFRTVVLHLIASLDLISAKNNLLVVYHPVCAKGIFGIILEMLQHLRRILIRLYCLYFWETCYNIWKCCKIPKHPVAQHFFVWINIYKSNCFYNRRRQN